MTTIQIAKRRLEIAVEMARLAEADVALRRQMIDVEAASTSLNRELAELDLEELASGKAITAARQRERVSNGDRHDGASVDGSRYRGVDD